MTKLLKQLGIVIGLLCLLLLNGCCPYDPGKYPVVIVPPEPCIIQPAQPNDSSMAKLGIRVIRVGDNVSVIIPSDEIFIVNTAEFQDYAIPGLNQLAAYLKSFGCIPMTVSTYTDNLGATQDEFWLAEQQTRSMITFLWTRGIPHTMLMAHPVGSDLNQTAAADISVSGSAVNRRIEITFRAPPKSMLTSWW